MLMFVTMCCACEHSINLNNLAKREKKTRQLTVTNPNNNENNLELTLKFFSRYSWIVCRFGQGPTYRYIRGQYRVITQHIIDPLFQWCAADFVNGE